MAPLRRLDGSGHQFAVPIASLHLPALIWAHRVGHCVPSCSMPFRAIDLYTDILALLCHALAYLVYKPAQTPILAN